MAEKDGKPAGEPTELALFEAALKAGYNKDELEQVKPRLTAIPFDSQRKQMTTLHQSGEGVVAYVKGAPEQLLAQCSAELNVELELDPALAADHQQASQGVKAFDAAAVLAEAEQLAHEGYRVLALAKRELEALPQALQAESIEQDLTFLGLVALMDPPRPEVPQAVADCLTAGITPVMITGDHPGTAMAIARRLGITNDDQAMLSGDELAKLSDENFARRVESIRVYARVSPQQKLRIVKAL